MAEEAGRAAVVTVCRVTAEHMLAAAAVAPAVERKVQFVRRQGRRPLLQPALVPDR